MNEEYYLIWSNEHNAWWRPARRGYTVNIEEAGRYPFDEAISICNGANFGWDKEDKLPHELPILEKAAIRFSGPYVYKRNRR